MEVIEPFGAGPAPRYQRRKILLVLLYVAVAGALVWVREALTLVSLVHIPLLLLFTGDGAGQRLTVDEGGVTGPPYSDRLSWDRIDAVDLYDATWYRPARVRGRWGNEVRIPSSFVVDGTGEPPLQLLRVEAEARGIEVCGRVVRRPPFAIRAFAVTAVIYLSIIALYR